MHFGPRPNACLSKCERTYAQTVHFFHLIYIFSPSSFSLSLSLPLTKRNVAFLAPCSYLPARIWPRVPLRAQGFSWILFSKRNFPLRGNMDEFIDLDLRRVRKNLFFINLLNFIREEDLCKSYLFKTCS